MLTMRRHSSTKQALTLLLSLVAAGCAVGIEQPSSTTGLTEPAAAASSTTTTLETTTTSGAPITTVSTTTTSMVDATTTSIPCGGVSSVEIPSGVADLSSVVGDLDADGRSDEVSVYQLEGDWFAHVQLGFGFGVERGLDDLLSETADRAAAAAVVEVGGGAALIDLDFTLIGPRYGFLVVHDCGLVPLALPSGDLPDLVVGGGMAHSWWFTCDPDGVTQYAVYTDTPGVDPFDPDRLSRWRYVFEPTGPGFVEEEVTLDASEARAIGELLAELPPCHFPAPGP